MSRLYVDQAELRQVGFSEPMIRTFVAIAAFVDVSSQIAAAQTSIDANADSIAELAANDVALSAQIEALDFVSPNTVPAPAYTPYAGQTVSVLYTQAEAQATDDAVKALGLAFGALVAALQGARVLT